MTGSLLQHLLSLKQKKLKKHDVVLKLINGTKTFSLINILNELKIYVYLDLPKSQIICSTSVRSYSSSVLQPE